MPIYEFQCNKCDHRFEEFFRGTTEKKKLKCPECLSKEIHKVSSLFGMSVERGNDTSASQSSRCDSCTATSCSHCR